MPVSPTLVGLQRLLSQHIAESSHSSPAALVAHFGAVQAQDYNAALWAIGLRCRIDSERIVQAAVADRSIVRSWPLRGTLHFVAAADLRWMLSLLSTRQLRAGAKRFRELELDEQISKRSQELLRKALEGGRQLTREELYHALEQGGVSTDHQRGYHLLWRASQEQVICWGPRRGKEMTFVLLDDWIPRTAPLTADESICKLATRYFTSHGPATLHDFVWWSGLTVAEARTGIETSGAALAERQIGGRSYWSSVAAGAPEAEPMRAAASIQETAFLLPAFDEYVVAYRDRSDLLEPAFARTLNAGGGMIKPVAVVAGHVVGVWKRTLRKGRVEIEVTPFRKLAASKRRMLELAVERYGSFVGVPAEMSIL